MIGRKPKNLIVGWCGRFVVPHQFSQDICKWPENQILISDWTYLHCPGATLENYNNTYHITIKSTPEAVWARDHRQSKEEHKCQC